MGVINLTPNSFSDGNANFIQNLLKNLSSFDLLDFGAESTAPFNEKVSAELEWERLSQLLPYKEQLRNKVLSLDTYKTQIMEKFIGEFNNHQIILNDVSGQLETEYLEILKANPEVLFVYSHNLVPSRLETNSHIDFVGEEKPDLIHYFSKAMELLKKHGLEKRVIFDPCFGFAKSREQNIELLRELPKLIQGFSKDQPWLIGVSRKSFLRKPPNLNVKDPAVQAQLDREQTVIIKDLMGKLSGYKIIFRTHTENSFKNACLSID